MIALGRPEPIWQIALRQRAREAADGSRCAAARLALVARLAQAGAPVSLVTVHTWSRQDQGMAYLWAVAVIQGREDLPMPQHVRDAVRNGCER